MKKDWMDVSNLLTWVLISLLGLVFSGIVGFTSVATGIAQLLFFVFLAVFAIVLVLYLREKKYIKWF